MAQPASPDTASPDSRPVARTAAAALLLVAVGGALLVPIYARSRPQLGAFPFFYWYQLGWVFVAAIACGLSYILLRPRPARRTRPRTPTGREDGARRDGAREDGVQRDGVQP